MRKIQRARSMDVRKPLIVSGALLIAAGVCWSRLRQLGLGRPPGDIVIGRPGVQIRLPIVTCLVVRLILTLFFSIIRK